MKKILVVILILALFIVAGCNKDVVEDGPFVGGTNGVSISFQEGTPISEFVVEDSIPVKVVLKNSGENDVLTGQAEVKLYGLLMQEYSLDESYKVVNQNIIGLKKDVVEEGGEAVVDMGTLKYTGVYSNSLEPVLKAKVCYPYKTISTITACASSREIIEAGGESTCVIDGEKISTTKVSSSPMQVTSFTEQLSGKDSVTFRVVIENRGIGEVYKDDQTCTNLDIPVTKSESQDKIKFTVTPEDITCTTYEGTQSNSGYIKLETGKKTLICNMKVNNAGSNYIRQININLDFKYMESVSKQLKILEA
ncbi:hypothetical protein J4438_01670 [Candidatus Woesearchaeota archaeon]|nr:hypothetical protein [Candidatus Woesearchaeota archaeon]